jgi:hypothetical protein
LVIFDDDLEAEKCAVAIKEVRRELRLSDNYEFHFSKTKREYRLAFLNRVVQFRFRVRAIVMIKKRIYGPQLRASKDSFYRYAIKMVLKHSFGAIRGARLKIDGHGDREFRRELQAYLRRELASRDGEPPVVSDLKFVESKRNVLVQLADMVASSVRRRADGVKADREDYYAVIRRRVEDLWEFGVDPDED